MTPLPADTQAQVDAAAKALVDRALATSMAHAHDPNARLTGLAASLHRELFTLPTPRRAEVVAARGKLPPPPLATRPAVPTLTPRVPVRAEAPTLARPLLRPLLPPQPQGTQPSLGLEATTLRCDRDTIELGDDELQLAAFFVDADLGQVLASVPTPVGSYRRGDSRALDLPPLVFNFQGPITFPHTFLAVLCLAEIDSGGFATFVADVLEALTAELEPPPATSTATRIVIGGVAIATAIGLGATGAAAAGALPLATGLIIASTIVAAVTYLTAIVAAWLGDELFPTQTVTLVVESATSGLAQGNQEVFTARFERSVGDYTLSGRFFLQS
jgi:hypothetical protein